ncbi:MAG: GntR family transcriptional regulator [Pyrinomonadaceae bacterium]
MKFWLSKNAEISLREQLASQVVLAIIGGDLRAGDKLPSVREMALRYQVHANTVSAAYIWLESRGWVESRRGSGVFVTEKSKVEIETAASSSASELDALVLHFIQSARSRGFTLEQIAARLAARFKQTQIKQICLIEPDAELRKILLCEIQSKIDLPITEMDLTNFTALPDTIFAALEETLIKLPPNPIQICLRLNSVQNEMRGKTRPASGELVGVVSRWETFLRWSKTMLVAAGIAHEQIILRDAKMEGWKRGLTSCKFVVADSLSVKKLAPNIDARVFRLIAEESLNELQNLVE